MKVLKRKHKTIADIPVTEDEPDEQAESHCEDNENVGPVDDEENVTHDTPAEEEADQPDQAELANGSLDSDKTETQNPEDANEATAKDLHRHELWKEEIRKHNAELDNLKEERKELNASIKDVEKKLKEAILVGPEGMFSRPLLDLAEQVNDADLWRQTPIADLDLPEKLKAKTADQFANVGDLVDWLNLTHRPKKEGLGAKTIEKLSEAVNQIHEPVIQSQLYDLPVADDPGQMPKEAEWETYRVIVENMLCKEQYNFASDTLDGIYYWICDHEHITEEQIASINNIRESIDS